MKKLFLLLLLLAGASLSAQTITWDGGGDGTSWDDELNWNDAIDNSDRVPTADDFAEIETTSSDLMIVVDTDDAIAGTLKLIGDQYNLSFTVKASAKLTVTDPNESFSSNLFQIRDLNSGAVIIVNNGEIIMSGDDTEESAGGFSGGGSNSSIENNGSILITQIGGVGISVTNFTNNGTLEIIDTGYDGSEAISISSRDLFINNGRVIVENNPYQAIALGGSIQPNLTPKLINNNLIELRGIIGGLDGNDQPVISGVNNSEIINKGLIQVASLSGPEMNIQVILLGSRGDNKIVNEECGVINIYTIDNIEILGSSTFSNAGIVTSANASQGNIGTIMNTGTVSTPDGSGNGLSIDGGTANTGPIPATESLGSSCLSLPETSDLPELPMQEVEMEVEDLPLLSSIWAKAGLGFIMMGMVVFLLSSRRI